MRVTEKGLREVQVDLLFCNAFAMKDSQCYY